MSFQPTPVGLCRDERHRYFLDGEGPYPSVTGIIGVVDKSGPLLGWARRETAAYAVRNLDLLTRMVKDFGPDQAAASLKTVSDKEAKDKAAIGSRVHATIEAVIRGHDVSPSEEDAPYIESYRRFLADYSPVALAAEEMVVSTTHGYAGTLDLIARMNGQVWMLDAKTGKSCYPETALQMAAYAEADWIGRANDPVQYRIPAIDRYGVIHLRPEGYHLVPYAVTPQTFRAFLTALDLWRWIDGEAKTIVGQPLDGGRLPDFPKEIAA